MDRSPEGRRYLHVFMKGSVQSLSDEGGLSESEYMSFGSKQCKLLPDQERNDVYGAS